MVRIGGILVVIYFVIGFIALWVTEPDATDRLLHPGMNRSVIMWPLVLYLEHF
jgi:hypothetical protein